MFEVDNECKKHYKECPGYTLARSLLAEDPLDIQIKLRGSCCETRIDNEALYRDTKPFTTHTRSLCLFHGHFSRKLEQLISIELKNYVLYILFNLGLTKKTTRNEYLNSKDLRERATKSCCCLDIYVYLSYRIAKLTEKDASRFNHNL